MMQPSKLITLALRLIIVVGVAAAQGLQAQGVEARIHGRVLLPDGSPAQGAKLTAVKRMRRSSARAGPIQWSTSVDSDSAGRFSLAYRPDPEGEFTLTAALDGYLALDWKWKADPRVPAKTLGDRRFEQAANLTGSIIDEAGELLTQGWQIMVIPRDDKNAALTIKQDRIQPDPDTGVFRVGPIAAGRILVVGHHDLGTTTNILPLDLGKVDSAHVLLELEGPNPFRSVFVKAEASKQAPFNLKGPYSSGLEDPEGSDLFLLDDSGRLLAEAEWHSLLGVGTWCFEDVPPGEYTVELRHPFFERVSAEGVRAGKLETIQLAGNAALEIDALDSRGERLEEWDASLRYTVRGAHLPPSSLRSAGITPDGGKRFEGIVPGEMAVMVWSPSGEKTTMDLGLVEPNETRRIQARLTAAETLVVQVTDEQGQALEGAALECTLGDRAASEASSMDRSLTDADGRCMIDGVTPGQWTIRAALLGYGEVTRIVQHPLPGGEPVAIRLSPVGVIKGHLRCAEGFDFGAVQLYLLSKGALESEAWNMRPRDKPRVGADGRFRTEELPVGQARFVIQLRPRSGYAHVRGQRSIHRVVDVAPGEQEWALDLEPLIAASCRVSCKLDGSPHPGMRVVLLDEARLSRSRERGTIHKLIGSRGTLDDYGRVVYSDLDPAATYTAFAVSAEEDWVAALGQVQAKSYLDPTQLDRSLHLVEREVLVRRAGGGSWAGTEFGWACQGAAPTGAKATASTQSTLTLRMPPGTYSLFRTGPKSPQRVPLDWQAGAGPLVVEIPEDG